MPVLPTIRVLRPRVFQSFGFWETVPKRGQAHSSIELISLAGMNESTSANEIYQFRVMLRETSPHVWRRLLVRSDSKLIDFHRVIQTAFGWSGRLPFAFSIQGHRSQAAAVEDPCRITLADFRLYPKERFSYDEQNAGVTPRPWRFRSDWRRSCLPTSEGTPALHCRLRWFRTGGLRWTDRL
jgi:Plasmid pRiA4b ORF-3-like protein